VLLLPLESGWEGLGTLIAN